MQPDAASDAPKVTYRPLTDDDFADAHDLCVDLVGEKTVPDGASGMARFARNIAMATLHLLPNIIGDGRPYARVENAVTLRTRRGQGLGAGVRAAMVAAAWDAGACKFLLRTGRTVGARGIDEMIGVTDQDKTARPCALCAQANRNNEARLRYYSAAKVCSTGWHRLAGQKAHCHARG